MAYAEVAGLPAVVGLWAAVASMLVYAVLGSSPQLSVGPESTTALMTATALGGLAAGQPERYAALAAALAGLVGLICLVAWVARLGFLADLLSRPVLVGYMGGVAVLMMVSQLGKLTGLTVDGDTTVGRDRLRSRPSGRRCTCPPSSLGASRPRRSCWWQVGVFPRAPVPLVGMLLAARPWRSSTCSARGITVVGVRAARPAVVPACRTYRRSDLRVLRAGRSGHRDGRLHRQRPDRAGLRGRGTAPGSTPTRSCSRSVPPTLPLAAAQGFPVSSSGSRTAIGDALGAGPSSIRWSPLGHRRRSPCFPRPGAGRLSRRSPWRGGGLRRGPARRRRRSSAGSPRFRRTEFALALGTTAAVLVLGVLHGVLVAVALSVLDLLHRVARPHDGILGFVPGVAGMHDSTTTRGASPSPGWWSTATTRRCSSPTPRTSATRALAAVDRAAEHRRAGSCSTPRRTSSIDITAVDTLEDAATGGRSDRASSSPWPGSSRTCGTTSSAAGFVDSSGGGHGSS